MYHTLTLDPDGLSQAILFEGSAIMSLLPQKLFITGTAMQTHFQN